MFGKPLVKLLLFLIIPTICFADSRTDQPGPVFGDVDGTNAGRYRSVKFTNGATTNNGDGSVTITTGSGSGSGNVGIGTTGRIPVYQASTTIGSPYNNTMDASGNIGIGSSSPGTALDVQGTIRASTDVKVGAVSLCRSDGTNCPASSGTNFWTNQAGAGNLGIGTVNNSVGIGTTKGNGVFIVMPTQDGHTNVGIGTWNPSTVFEVIGTGGVGIGTNLQDSGLKIMTGNLGIGTWLVDSGALIVTTAAGNVGVGTIRPGTPLDVNGTVRMTAFQLTGNGASSGNVMVTNSVGVGTWMASTTLPNTTTFANPSASVSTSAVNGVATTAMRSDAAPQIDQALVPTWTGKHAFNATPIAYTTGSGNVGIGSLTPGQPLDVAGTIRSTNFVDTGLTASKIVLTAADKSLSSSAVTLGTMTDTKFCTYDNASTSILCTSSGGGSGTINSGTTNRAAYYSGATTLDSSTKIFNDNTNVGIGTINPRTSVEIGVQTMNINGTNVGIGSITPGQPLDVAGTIRSTAFVLTGNGAAAGSVLTSSSTVGIGTWMAVSSFGIPVGANPSASVSTAAVNGSALTFMRSDGAPQIDQAMTPTWTGLHTFNKSGISLVTVANVGIGTAAPTGRLEVEGGNVGIGTWNPVAALHIATAGDSFFGGNVGIGTNQVQTNALGVVGALAVGTVAYTGITAPTNGMQVTGNVGIGTWTTLNALDVNGNVGIGAFAGQKTPDAIGAIIQGNVGIGTFQNDSALTVMNGNIGIGTWTPYAPVVIVTGPVGVGTIRPTQTMEIKGTFSVRGAQTSPFTMKAAANQACNTTCTASQCSGAEDTSVIGTFVSCSDATADNCFCMGP